MSPSTTRTMHSLQQHLRQYLARLGHCMADALSTVPVPQPSALGTSKSAVFLCTTLVGCMDLLGGYHACWAVPERTHA